MTDDEKLLDIAIDYYIRKKTQAEIARVYNVSHVQIGNYLKEAQRKGIVTISVNLPVSKDETDNLNELFKTIFHIKNVVLVQGSDNSDKALERVAEKAASYMLETLPNNVSRIGIGWGKTMHDVTLVKNRGERKSNWVYYPACLLEADGDNPYFDTVRLTRNLAQNWGGKVDGAFIDRLLIERKFPDRRIALKENGAWRSLHVLVAGLGCATSRFPSQREGMFTSEVFKEINTKNIVGDILHNYYDIDGNLYTIAGNEILIPVDDIARVPWVVAVACGFTKVESIIGGLRTGLVDTLVTDIQTAHHVIDYLK